MAAWIRVRIPNPDPGGLKRVNKEGKNASKRKIIRDIKGYKAM
jgi:hypothetical protein